ncbi:uncharacterized protein LOC109836607 isoform X1 [Asparagus officinalis]|uniref:uncharacterized protein LOC109836607 isoform X1 n=1 Tax=Asparagus officinalis TaxID=4686 RepID=UPI00098E40BE|nr:uncharacterized protein LOC109836607 isoform X1 [Asparagus officinalis]XP_020260153.1 uncharacterized protein LOC109836607 isoform X1 [Asparagus officinalis]
MATKRSSCKRALVEFLDGNDEDADKVYRFQILLPNGANTRLTLHDPGEEMFIHEFVHAIRVEVEKIEKSSQGSRRKIMWNNDIYLEDMHESKMKKKICFSSFKPNKCHILKLHDGGGPSVGTYNNMWDLTPDTDLLQELPAEYTFETALADLIDNSLQAVWSNSPGERRLVSVTLEERKVVIFDSGPGMDGSDENSITKWGKMGSSNHRSSRKIAIGGKAPYLTPFFGMFGYGGPIASMHLGRHAIVSSKTKESKKVYTLHLSREALMKRSADKCIWRADGGIRDPLDEEIQLSPHGSFTKVEIHNLKLRCMETFKLRYWLKDVYFPYIQCDEHLTSKRTTMPIEFQVNHTDLAEIASGEVAVTNLHSCNGPDFVLQLHLTINEGDPTSTSSGSRSCRQANARLKCVYFPIVEGKENIDRILEKLQVDGFPTKEDFEKFSRVSIRRLGRLLPDARWRALPFMEPQNKKGEKGQLLRRCCHRVKCFIDTDAGFSPTPSKTDLAHHDFFTLVLRNIGSKPSGEESVATIEIRKDGKPLNLLNLEKEFHDWVFQMHALYDEEAECGEDEPVLVFCPSRKNKLGISADGNGIKYHQSVVRVHKVIRRKGRLWESGQKVKIIKGAVGCSKNNLYATLEYFLLEGFQGDAGGEAHLVCRLVGCPDEKGCLLVVNDGYASLNIRDSRLFPISEIDNGKIQPIDGVAWNYQLEKKQEKAPSWIDILTSEHCSQLNIKGELPLDIPVEAGYDPPDEIVAVIRPSCYNTSTSSKGLDQKFIVKDDLEMSMEVRLVCGGKGSPGGDLVFAQRIKPSLRNGFHGLYIFPLRPRKAKLFCKSGVYIFSFSVVCKDSSCKKRELSVAVKPASSIVEWKLYDKGGPLGDKSVPIRVGSHVSYLSVTCLDQFMNSIPFSSLPIVKIKVSTKDFLLANIDKMKIAVSSNQLFVEITDMLFESSKLDVIRPCYEAALGVYSLEDVLIVEVPCRAMPGPPSSIKMQCSSEVEKHLSPGTVIKEFVLEVLDACGNHIEEGVEIPVQVDGLCFQDYLGSIRKVSDQGNINLSGLLKVTAGYGSRVHVLVSVGGKVIFEKMFRVMKRELRVISKVTSYFSDIDEHLYS